MWLHVPKHHYNQQTYTPLQLGHLGATPSLGSRNSSLIRCMCKVLFFFLPCRGTVSRYQTLVSSPPKNHNKHMHTSTSTPTASGVIMLAPFVALVFLPQWSSLVASTDEGFCSVRPLPPPEETESKTLYWKVINPTLSPVHLRDLPGFTRSVFRQDHAVITPESHVFSPLNGWFNTMGAYLITSAMGSHFSMLLAKMHGNSRSGLPPKDFERFLFVIDGTVILSNDTTIKHKLPIDAYAYLPANSVHSITCDSSATLIIFERRYESYPEIDSPELVIGSTDKQPLLETPGEVFELRKLLPTSASYDFNIHIMDFLPGEFLNVKEVHYNQHGLLLLEGQGIYRLGDSWYPVQTGDAIWMAPFVPQWYAALGKTRTRYLLYKDVNRYPI